MGAAAAAVTERRGADMVVARAGRGAVAGAVRAWSGLVRVGGGALKRFEGGRVRGREPSPRGHARRRRVNSSAPHASLSLSFSRGSSPTCTLPTHSGED